MNTSNSTTSSPLRCECRRCKGFYMDKKWLANALNSSLNLVWSFSHQSFTTTICGKWRRLIHQSFNRTSKSSRSSMCWLQSVLHYYWQHQKFTQTNQIATLSKTLMPRTHVLHLRNIKSHTAIQFESLTQRICVLHKSKIRRVTVTASNQVIQRINVLRLWNSWGSVRYVTPYEGNFKDLRWILNLFICWLH